MSFADAAPNSPIIILTGASRGLGLAVLSILLSTHNARVTTLSRSVSPALQALATQYGDARVLLLQGDVGEAEVNARAVRETVRKWGGVDGLVLNAGTMNISRIDAVPLDAVPGYIQTNLASLVYLVQPALPYLRKSMSSGAPPFPASSLSATAPAPASSLSETTPAPTSSLSDTAPASTDTARAAPPTGRIVLVSSGASSKGYVGWGLYSAVKAALNSFARTLAAEEALDGTGVGVWAVRPGLVDMQDLLRSSGAETMHPGEFAKFKTAHEQGKLLAPEQPGSVLAGLVARGGPMELSGEYLDWADERLAGYRA